MSMKYFNIRMKLFLVFLFFIFIIIFEGITSIYYINNMFGLFGNMYKSNLLPLNELHNIESEINNLRLNTYRYIGTADPDSMDKAKGMIHISLEVITSKLKQQGLSIGEIQKQFSAYTDINTEILDLHYNFNTREAYHLISGKSQKVYDDLTGLVLARTKVKKLMANKSMEQGHNIKQTILIIMATVIINSIILTIIIGIIFAKNLTWPIYQIRDSLHKLGKGELATDLDQKILKRPDEFGAMAQDYTTTKTILSGLISNLQNMNKDLVEAKDVADTANKAKSEFLTNMSHEIRTPLNTILGFTEILSVKEADTYKKRCLSSIFSSGTSLLNLINDVLDLSKVEAGQLQLEYSVVSSRMLFNEMEAVFGQKIRDKGLKFILDTPSDLPSALMIDESRIRQILINLIGNAIKFTESGYIKLSAQYHYPKSLQHSTIDFIFSVEDTGIGIPLDQQDYIFGAFSQMKGQKTSDYGGTGLGLSITNRLIEIMGGEIILTSEVGKGSIFNIVLKNVEIASIDIIELNSSEQIDLSSILFEKCKVLIVDDIELNRELIRDYLVDYDFTLFEAINGKEAIEEAKAQKPDLILLDMKMPVMDGYEASTLLKEDDVLKNIPIIAVTASAMKKDQKAISKLCDSYLKKPVNKTDLVLELVKFLPHIVKEVPDKTKHSVSRSSQEISAKDLEQYPELFEILKKEQTHCKQLAKLMAINKIENFTKKLEELGVKYNYQPLIDFSNDLYISAQIFDMGQIEKHLKKFQSFI